MLQTVAERRTTGEAAAFRDVYLKAYRRMLLARVLDDKLATLFRGAKIHGGVFLGRGQEALSVATASFLVKGDIFAPLIRDAAGRLAFGETVLEAVRTCLGSVLGPMRGRDGNVHRGRPYDGLLPMISHLGAMDFRGERPLPARPSFQGRHRHRRRGFPRRRWDFHGRIP